MRRLAPLVLLALCSACRHAEPPLPVMGAVPDFTLTTQTGKPFDRAELNGKVWVADWIFTHCLGPCPRMTSQMHQVQEAVFKMPEVRLVSFTVDPERDTPEVLQAYAKQHHASPRHWDFLTGNPATLHHLSLDVFKLQKLDGSLMHSTRFVLIDKKSQIRGYYDTSEPDSIDRLIHDIHVLARERAS